MQMPVQLSSSLACAIDIAIPKRIATEAILALEIIEIDARSWWCLINTSSF
jgi:hypothetical protein